MKIDPDDEEQVEAIRKKILHEITGKMNTRNELE